MYIAVLFSMYKHMHCLIYSVIYLSIYLENKHLTSMVM
jgi:hypothetical protein